MSRRVDKQAIALEKKGKESDSDIESASEAEGVSGKEDMGVADDFDDDDDEEEDDDDDNNDDDDDDDADADADADADTGTSIDSDGAPNKLQKTGTRRRKKVASGLQNTISMNEVTQSQSEGLINLARYRKIFEPFITKKVLHTLLQAVAEKAGKTQQGTNNKNHQRGRHEDVRGEEEEGSIMTQPPSLSTSCKMRSYQLEGFSWLVSHYMRGINCILADEMGLGKTLQSIAFVSYLTSVKHLSGPFLFVVPLSVLFNWMSEFRKFCPALKVLRLHSTDKEEQLRLRKQLNDPNRAQCVVTTYDCVKSGGLSHSLHRIVWRSVFLDEGHRIKNENSQLAKSCHCLRSRFRVVLTGTPVQNNLHEFGALLRYLAPNVFTDLALFDPAFNLDNRSRHRTSNPNTNVDGDDAGHTEATQVHAAASKRSGNSSHQQIDRALLAHAHLLMKPFVLRRLKSQVEQRLPPKYETKINCPMSEVQRELTKSLLVKEHQLLTKLDQAVVRQSDGNEARIDGQSAAAVVTSSSAGSSSGGTSSGSTQLAVDKTRLMSLLASLRKAANHPFLFPGIEKVAIDGRPTEEIVNISGKMKILDQLLGKLYENGHRVVLFSQYTHTLDILSDYLDMRGYRFTRLDGSTNRVMREVRINLFNKPQSPLFLFALSTRAGGEGVNLFTADTVILFDSDWNPQVDIQAMARVHRIGQTRIVHVYRLVTAGSVEECIVQRAQRKLFLDNMVNRGGGGGGGGGGGVGGGQSTAAQSQSLVSTSEKDEDEDGNDKDEEKDEEKEEDATSRSRSKSQRTNKNTRASLKRKTPPSDLDASMNAVVDDEPEQHADASKIFAAVKFGWNSVFSVSNNRRPHQSKEQQMQVLSEEDIIRLIDRTRGLDGKKDSVGASLSALRQSSSSTSTTTTTNRKRTSTSAATNQSKNRKRSVAAQEENEQEEIEEGHGNEEGEKEAEEEEEEEAAADWQENQEYSLESFDEHAPMVRLDDLRQNQYERAVHMNSSALTISSSSSSASSSTKIRALPESADVEAVVVAATTTSNDSINSSSNSSTTRNRPQRNAQRRTTEVLVEGLGKVQVLADVEDEFTAGGRDAMAALERRRARQRERERQQQSMLYITHSGRQVAGRDFQHQEICQVCWDGGDMIICDSCPMSFHFECLGYSAVPKDKMWHCPHHKCSSCYRSVSAATLLFRCEACPNAYCEDCLPAEVDIHGHSPRLEQLGYRMPKNACYILCCPECKATYAEEVQAPTELTEPHQKLTPGLYITAASAPDEEEEAKLARIREQQAVQQARLKEAKMLGLGNGATTTTTTGSIDDNGIGSGDSKSAQLTSSSGQQQRLELINNSLDNCSLPDIRHRLGYDKPSRLHVKFTSLGEVPSFQSRLKQCNFRVQTLLYKLIKEIARFEGGLLLKHSKPLPHNSSSGTVSAGANGENEAHSTGQVGAVSKTTNDAPEQDEEKNGLADADSIADVVSQFAGCRCRDPADITRVFLHTVAIIAQAQRFELFPLSQVLGLCFVTQLIRPKPIPENIANDPTAITLLDEPVKQAFWEPKFSWVKEFPRQKLEEAIAAFLVLPSPENLLLSKSTSQARNCLPVDSLFYVSRLLNALGERIEDDNGVFFTAVEVMNKKRLPQVRHWRVAAPTAPATPIAVKQAWLFPAARLFQYMRCPYIVPGDGQNGPTRRFLMDCYRQLGPPTASTSSNGRDNVNSTLNVHNSASLMASTEPVAEYGHDAADPILASSSEEEEDSESASDASDDDDDGDDDDDDDDDGEVFGLGPNQHRRIEQRQKKKMKQLRKLSSAGLDSKTAAAKQHELLKAVKMTPEAELQLFLLWLNKKLGLRAEGNSTTSAATATVQSNIKTNTVVDINVPLVGENVAFKFDQQASKLNRKCGYTVDPKRRQLLMGNIHAHILQYYDEDDAVEADTVAQQVPKNQSRTERPEEEEELQEELQVQGEEQQSANGKTNQSTSGKQHPARAATGAATGAGGRADPETRRKALLESVRRCEYELHVSSKSVAEYENEGTLGARVEREFLRHPDWLATVGLSALAARQSASAAPASGSSHSSSSSSSSSASTAATSTVATEHMAPTLLSNPQTQSQRQSQMQSQMQSQRQSQRQSQVPLQEAADTQTSNNVIAFAFNGWRQQISMQERLALMPSIERMLKQVASQLCIASVEEFNTKIQQYELGLLISSRTKEDYLNKESLPRRLSLIVSEFSEHKIRQRKRASK